MGEDTLHALYRAQIGKGRNQAFSMWPAPPVITAGHKPLSRPHWSIYMPTLFHTTIHRKAQPTPARSPQHDPFSLLQTSATTALIRATSPQMPTRLREMLYALQLTCVVRTLEGLREKGIQTGQVIHPQTGVYAPERNSGTGLHQSMRSKPSHRQGNPRRTGSSAPP